MYCSNCGNELTGAERVCPSCGTPVVTSPAAQGQPLHTSYEYARTTVANDLVTVTCDCYENLGWELTGSKMSSAGGTTALSFRRSRKIKNKAQLVKIQRTMDDLIDSIAGLEGEKTRKATVRAVSLGIVAALVLGVGMCLAMGVLGDLFALGIVVGVFGIAMVSVNYFIYRAIAKAGRKKYAGQILALSDELLGDE